MPVEPELLADALKRIERQYGGGVVHSGDKELDVSRLSTGSLELDYATGGGVPLGRCTHFWGSWSAGKTLIGGWNVIRSAQKAGLSAAYYNVEKQFDKKFAARCGVDVGKLHVVDETTIEGVGTILEELLGSINVHVIDSLAAAVSVDELNSKLEDWQIGLAARAWGKVLRRANDRMDPNENLVVMINHARSSLSGGEGAPGGRMIEHQSSCTVHFRRGKWLFYDGDGCLNPGASSGGTMSGDMEADGVEIVCRVEKSRVSRPLRTARIYWDFKNTAIDRNFEYSKAAIFTGVVEDNGNGRFVIDDEKLHGRRKLRERISGDKALQERIESALLALT